MPDKKQPVQERSAISRGRGDARSIIDIGPFL